MDAERNRPLFCHLLEFSVDFSPSGSPPSPLECSLSLSLPYSSPDRALSSLRRPTTIVPVTKFIFPRLFAAESCLIGFYDYRATPIPSATTFQACLDACDNVNGCKTFSTDTFPGFSPCRIGDPSGSSTYVPDVRTYDSATAVGVARKVFSGE